MEAKPFTIQSPKDVAEQYGGNKQKIAEAIKLGVVDSTAGVLAGMFIDRMRAAAQAEQVPQQTIAQQVLAPPAPPMPPQGLGAIAPPGMGMPPQGMPMPPQGGMPPQMAMQDAMPPQGGMPPQGMAMGGMYDPPYTQGGGLSDLPLPAGMFDEPDNGSYAGGGIVAFAAGSPGEMRDRYGRRIDMTGAAEDYDAAYGEIPTDYLNRNKKYYLDQDNSETIAADNRRTQAELLLALAGRMAGGTSQYWLKNVGDAVSATVPDMVAARKESRAAAEKRSDRLADIERGEYDRKSQRVAGKLTYGNSLATSDLGERRLTQEGELARERQASEERMNASRNSTTLQAADKYIQQQILLNTRLTATARETAQKAEAAQYDKSNSPHRLNIEKFKRKAIAGGASDEQVAAIVKTIREQARQSILSTLTPTDQADMPGSDVSDVITLAWKPKLSGTGH